MLIVKVPAVVAAVLFMSVSAHAMEFANRPGSISETFTTALTVRAMQNEERLRSQISNHTILMPVSVAWMKLADRPRPISNPTRVWVVKMTLQNRSGRLSDEFSAAAISSRIKFEYGPDEVSSWFKLAASTMGFDHHQSPIGNLFPPLADEDITFADRGFTSSLPKTNIPSEIWSRNGSARLCVGGMAPCGSLNFADMGNLSPAYTDERL
jgi:hypothetical protein